jgi:hypothetical protein
MSNPDICKLKGHYRKKKKIYVVWVWKMSTFIHHGRLKLIPFLRNI